MKAPRLPHAGKLLFKSYQSATKQNPLIANDTDLYINDEEVMPPDYIWDRICAILDAQDASQHTNSYRLNIAQG